MDMVFGSDAPLGVFSCVVDSDPRFHFEALRWYATLRRVAAVQAHDMVVNAVGGTDSDILNFLRSQGVTVEAIEPFAERWPWCNKISGAIRLAERGVEGSAVLTDTDFVVLEDPRRLNIPPGAVASRLVGFPRPSLRILENIFETAELEIPGLEHLDWRPGEVTVSGHGNGGLYIIPGATLSTLVLSWTRWAKWLMEHVALLENFPTCVDQVAMPLAATELGITPHRLDMRWNFPFKKHSELIPSDVDRPAGIHYHRNVDRGGLLKRIGIAAVDEQIDSANQAFTQVWHEAFPNASLWDCASDIYPENDSGVNRRDLQVKDKGRFRTSIVDALHKGHAAFK